ncbi:MBL fold metallo-hydrolase [Patescibacteria group bacterium]|nr:MBL fold metallo-hydrolase [Patescibacteria group bacterium]MBU1124047.1 MBL fold metallo-hydrolase [Patescibacteria group bacterium]MBU1911017.1 MBL fold metallo-hydrolase [Patescibacteria group bacterium]
MSSPTSPHHLLLAATLVALLLCIHELTRLPDGKLHAYFLNVGQGDSALLITPTGKQILIDGGPDMSSLEHLGKYMPFFDRSLDLVILTHPHADHLTSLTEVLRRYKIISIMLAGTESNVGRYQSMIDEIKVNSIPLIIPDPTKDIDIGDGVTLDIIWPDNAHNNLKNENNSSIVLRVLYKDQSILLTGDIEEEVENQILKSGADITTNILKVPHHGSRTSSSTGFLLAVNPELAVISVGKENDHGHPSLEVVERYEGLGVSVRMTDEEGDVEVER